MRGHVERRLDRPSTRLSRLGTTEHRSLQLLSAARASDPRPLVGLVRGELGRIVMKCLERQRDRRYPFAADLARDVERFLDDLPVSAGLPMRRTAFQAELTIDGPQRLKDYSFQWSVPAPGAALAGVAGLLAAARGRR